MHRETPSIVESSVDQGVEGVRDGEAVVHSCVNSVMVPRSPSSRDFFSSSLPFSTSAVRLICFSSAEMVNSRAKGWGVTHHPAASDFDDDHERLILWHSDNNKRRPWNKSEPRSLMLANDSDGTGEVVRTPENKMGGVQLKLLPSNAPLMGGP